MNKRQAKKKEQKEIMLFGRNNGNSYKERREILRERQIGKINYIHRHKFFRGFDEIELFFIKTGMQTEEEVKRLYGRNVKTNNRFGQILKYWKQTEVKENEHDRDGNDRR